MARLDRRTLSVWASLALFGCHVELFDPLTASEGASDIADEGDEANASVATIEDSGEGADEGGDEEAGSPAFDVLGDDPAMSSSCEFAASLPSHLGCEFFGVDLDQAGLADYDAYGFVIINPQSRDVLVTVERFVGHEWLISESATIEPQQTHVFLPSDMHKLTTGLFDSAVLRIHSSLPVVAIEASPAQYNTEQPGFSASATLMQPSSGWTRETRVAGWRTQPGMADQAFLGVVTLEDFTPINVDLTFPLDPPPDDQAARFPMSFDEPVTVGMGQLLRLSALADPGDPLAGLAGTRIWSGQEQHSVVFSAHACAAIPSYEGSCGHTQEQLGNGLLGRHFVAPRLLARVDGSGDDVPELIYERTMIQVVANEPDTLISVIRADNQVLESVVIDPDEPYTIMQRDSELAVTSDKPVTVAAYMTNAEFTELGSASMVQLAPVEQWTTSHWVWVPQGFETHLVVLGDPLTDDEPGAISITALAGVPLALLPDQVPDPVPLPSAPTTWIGKASVTADGVGAHDVTRWALGPGVYRVESLTPTSVVVVGARVMDGFAYLGGWGPSLVDIGPPT